MKKAGFNNESVFFNSEKTKNLLGLSGLPFVGGSGGLTPPPSLLPEDIVVVAGTQSTINTIFTSIATFDFDPSIYPDPKEVRFEVALESTAGLTGIIRLYDRTLGTQVAGTLLTTVSSTSELLTSTVLSLPNANHTYEVHIKLGSTTGSGEEVTCKLARLQIKFV
jgi:hypothetical protein